MPLATIANNTKNQPGLVRQSKFNERHLHKKKRMAYNVAMRSQN